METISDTENHHSLFTSARLPHKQLEICVILPARNEEKNILSSLDALRQQIDEKGERFSPCIYEVLLLINNSNDRSYLIAKEYQKLHPTFALHIANIKLSPESANIGTARRILMDEAYYRLSKEGNKGIIVSTDSDSQVSKQWLYHIKQELGLGYDAVGGRILTYSNNKRVRLYHLRNVCYRYLLSQAESKIDPVDYDPWPRHYQFYGANFAVTSSMYHECGRLPQVAYLEDNAFYNALIFRDAKIRRSNKVIVYTSDRMKGKVAVGFSEQLKKWSELEKNKNTQYVESVNSTLTKYKFRYLLRSCYNNYISTGIVDNESLRYISDNLLIKYNWLEKELKKSQYFGELWLKTEKEIPISKWIKRYGFEPIVVAIAILRETINTM